MPALEQLLRTLVMYDDKAAIAPVKGADVVNQKCAPATLEAYNLSYTVNGKTILSEVNALFSPRRVTAIMGASLSTSNSA